MIIKEKFTYLKISPHAELRDDQIELLKKIGKILSEYESETGKMEVVKSYVKFDESGEFKEFSWNGIDFGDKTLLNWEKL